MTLLVATLILAIFCGLFTSVTLAVADRREQGREHDTGGVETLRRLLLAVLALAGNLAILVLLHAVFCDTWDIFHTLRRLAERKISYQRMDFLYGIPIGWLPSAALLGLGLRSALRLEDDPPPADARRKKQFVLLFDVSVIGLSILAALSFSVGGTRHLRINEICAKNLCETVPSGYVELRNDGGFPCRVTGLCLTDNENKLRKLEIPEGRVEPGGLLLVPLTQGDFSFSRSGGSTVILSDRSGSVIDRVTVNQKRDGALAFSLSEDGKVWRYMLPSPGAPNNAAAAVIAKPQISAPSGYYEKSFDVTLTADPADGNVTIHYTTDGSTPTADSPVCNGTVRVYDRSDEPNRWRAVRHIVYDWQNARFDDTPVKKAFVLRAIAVREDGAKSAEAVASYFVGSRFDRNRTVLSLVADDEAMFGEDGIYVTGKTYDAWYQNNGSGDRPLANFENRNREIPVNIQYFSNGKTLTFEQRGGLKVQGGSTRWLPLKRFTVFSRKQYSGKKVFPIQLFPGKATHSVCLRDGFCNAFSMVTVADRDIAVLQSLPVSVYINGEFWYDTYMQEKYNNTYFRQTYGVNEAEFIKLGTTDEIRAYLSSHDLSDDENLRGFDRIVDIQSYIDYICANVYLGNTDYSEIGNAAMWRATTHENDSYGDGRWRWCLYDMDLQTAGCRQNYGMLDITDAQLDTFNIVCDWDPPVNEREIYVALKANADFRRRFVLTFMDMVNTDFAEARMAALLEEWGTDISYDEYFFRDRPANMIGFLAKEYDLTGKVETLTVEVSDAHGGEITVNTARPEFTDGVWTGQYFTDYPVTVTARANPGYRFVGWNGDPSLTDETIEIDMKGGAAVYAAFEKE